MKEERKKRRYFTNWYHENKGGLAIVFSILSMIIIWIISYRIILYKYFDELNIYPSDVYNILEEIVTLTLKEEDIDESLIPEYVEEYNISYSKYDDKIIYTYSLDIVGDRASIIPKPSMVVTLSKEYEIISKDSVYSTRTNYRNYIKKEIRNEACSLCIALWIMLEVSFFIIYILKEKRKKLLT